jgi:hypothetical protein
VAPTSWTRPPHSRHVPGRAGVVVKDQKGRLPHQGPEGADALGASVVHQDHLGDPIQRHLRGRHQVQAVLQKGGDLL